MRNLGQSLSLQSQGLLRRTMVIYFIISLMPMAILVSVLVFVGQPEMFERWEVRLVVGFTLLLSLGGMSLLQDNVRRVLSIRNGAARAFAPEPVSPLGPQGDELAQIDTYVGRMTALLDAKRRDLAATQARLEKTQSELIEAEKLASVGQIVASVSHELNNPLTAILSNAESIETLDSGMSPDLAARVAAIKEQVLRIETVLQKMKGLKAVRSSKYVGNAEMVDLDASSGEAEAGVA